MTVTLMKRILLATLLGASLASTPLLASPFISFGLLNQKATTNWSHQQKEVDGMPGLEPFFSGDSESDTSMGFFIRGGYLLNLQNRLSVELARVGQDAKHELGTLDADSGNTVSMSHDITSLVAHYDYLYSVTGRVSLYAGLHLGVVHSDLDTLLGNDSDLGMQYGLQMGAAYQFTPQWSVDFSYSYSLTTAENRVSEQANTFKVELDELSAFRLGLSYLF